MLPRRQELPNEAVWEPQALIKALQAGATGEKASPLIVAISYCWLTKQHPDPNSFHLGNLAPLIKAFASWNRVRSEQIAVFIDWCSLPQTPMSESEQKAYQRAMQHVHLWYAHTATNVWMLT